MASVYIHIPFCERKCQYCDFVSYVGKLECLDKYVDSLINEIKSFDAIDIDTVYIGGGTPSLLSEKSLSKIFDTLNKYHHLDKNAEISIECNPNSLSEEKLVAFKKVGINRISLGVQSLNNEVLKSIGRLHNRAEALNALNLAKKYFDNISVDLMVGLPNQTIQDVVDDINALCPLVNHISVYSLILEEGTPLYDRVQSKQVILPDEDETIAMYDTACKELKKYDFIRYEVSNFTINKPCKHNIAYWTQKDYYGFGVASHSFVNGVRYSNTESLNDYLSGVTCVESYNIDKKIAKEEYIMLRLRMSQGIDLTDFSMRFGESLETKKDIINNLIDDGILCEKDNHLKLTDLGFHLLNYVVLQLVD